MIIGVFGVAVANELAAARKGHPAMNSVHEGYAVIMEEVGEFWQEVMKKPSARNPKRLAEELVQIAAMCQRTAEDLHLDHELVKPLPATGKAA